MSEAFFDPPLRRCVKLHPDGTRVGWLEGETLQVAPAWGAPTGRALPCAVGDWWFVAGAIVVMDAECAHLWWGTDALAAGPDLASALQVEAIRIERVDVAGDTVAIHVVHDGGPAVLRWRPGGEVVVLANDGRGRGLDGRLEPAMHIDVQEDGQRRYIAYDEVFRREVVVAELSVPDRRMARFVAVTADGQALWTAGHPDTDTDTLLRYPIDGAGREIHWMSEEYDLLAARCSPDGSEVDLVRSADPQGGWLALSQVAADMLYWVNRQVEGPLVDIQRGPGDLRWLVSTSDAGYLLCDREQGRVEPVLQTRPVQRRWPTLRVEPAQGKRSEITCLLTRPEDAWGLVLVAEDPRMRCLMPGGYSAWHQWLASLGIAALTVHPRGSYGYGVRFVEWGAGRWADVVKRDLVPAANQIAERESLAAIGAVGTELGGDLAVLASRAAWCRVIGAYSPVLDWVAAAQQRMEDHPHELSLLGDVSSPIRQRRLRKESPMGMEQVDAELILGGAHPSFDHGVHEATRGAFLDRLSAGLLRQR